jgi:hypothetical protein
MENLCHRSGCDAYFSVTNRCRLGRTVVSDVGETMSGVVAVVDVAWHYRFLDVLRPLGPAICPWKPWQNHSL